MPCLVRVQVDTMPATSSDLLEEPEDILSNSLQTLYSYTPVIISNAGFTFSYVRPGESIPFVTLLTPDTHANNWALHASSIWISSIYLANHIQDLDIDAHISRRLENAKEGVTPARVEVLEMGAGAGLPGISISKYLKTLTNSTVSSPIWRVTLSDYPDEQLIKTLRENVQTNGLDHLNDACVVRPYAWGTDTSSLLSATYSTDSSPSNSSGFDLIIAADTLWNPDLHQPFYSSLCSLLRKSSEARVYLVASLHTGPYTIEGFLKLARNGELTVESVTVKEINGDAVRDWQAEREDRDEVERRRWIVWIVLKWNGFSEPA